MKAEPRWRGLSQLISLSLNNSCPNLYRFFCNKRSVGTFVVGRHQTLAIAHYGYVLSKGRVVAEGTSQELARRDEVREAYFG